MSDKLLSEKMVKKMHVRFVTIYGNKFLHKFKIQKDFDDWYNLWQRELSNVSPFYFKAAFEHCENNLPWPPTVFEFKIICEKVSGVPDFEQCFQLAIKKDFSHPLVKLAYDGIGDYEMRHGREIELRVRFKTAYATALIEFRRHPEQPAPVEKKEIELQAAPKSINRSTLSEMKQKYEKIAKKYHPEWDRNKLNENSKEFDLKYLLEYKIYITSLSDIDSITLSFEDKLNRILFNRENNAVDELKRSIPNLGIEREEKNNPRPFKSFKRSNDYWNN